MKTPTNERTIGAFEGVPASALRIKDKYELDGSQPRSQKDSTRPPARPILTTTSALRCLSARVGMRFVSLPSERGFWMDFSGPLFQSNLEQEEDLLDYGGHEGALRTEQRAPQGRRAAG